MSIRWASNQSHGTGWWEMEFGERSQYSGDVDLWWRSGGTTEAGFVTATKSVELEIVNARVHLLNKGGLYKINQTKKYVLTSWHRCSSLLLTPRVINKVHNWSSIWDQYIISKCFSLSKTLFHSAHHALKLIKSQQATTSYPSDCYRTHARASRGSAHRMSWVGIIQNVALAGLYAIPATSHQMSGLVDRQA